MKLTLARACALVLAASAVAGGCTKPRVLPAKAGSNEIVLGAIYPLSGPQSEGGEQEFRGASLAVERINATGGVHGRRVRLESVDVPRRELAPAAVAALQAKGVQLVLGTYGSTISEVASAEIAARHMLLWETGAVGLVSSDAKPGSSFFRVAPTGATLGTAAVDFVTGQLAPLVGRPARSLRWATAYVDDAFGRAVTGGARADIASRRLHLVGAFPYDPHRVDMKALVRKIAAKKPDVLFVTAYLQDGIALRKQMLAQHLRLRVNIGTSSSYCMEDFGKALGGKATGLFASDKSDGDHVRVSALSPTARVLLAWAQQRYRARWHEGMPAAALGGLSNAWALLRHVLPAAADLTPGAVARAALATKLSRGSLPSGSGLDLAGPTAPDAGTNRAATSVIWEWTKPNTRTVVWPPTFATAPIVPPRP